MKKITKTDGVSLREFNSLKQKLKELLP